MWQYHTPIYLLCTYSYLSSLYPTHIYLPSNSTPIYLPCTLLLFIYHVFYSYLCTLYSTPIYLPCALLLFIYHVFHSYLSTLYSTPIYLESRLYFTSFYGVKSTPSYPSSLDGYCWLTLNFIQCQLSIFVVCHSSYVLGNRQKNYIEQKNIL